jgi:hypothetical protein
MFHIDDVPSGAGEGIKDLKKAFQVEMICINISYHFPQLILVVFLMDRLSLIKLLVHKIITLLSLN